MKRKVNQPNSKPEEKSQPERKRAKKVKADLTKLADAATVGKLLADIGSKVYFERFAPKGKKVIHEGYIRSVDEKGNVEIWDETKEQFYCFNLHQTIPTVKIA